MNLSVIPDLRAANDPLGPAVADDRTGLNNAQFLDAVQSAGAMLLGRGVSGGDVVAITPPNTAAFVVSLFAAWRLGAAVTPVDPSQRPAQMRRQLSDAGARVLIAETAPQFDTGAVDVVTVPELACGDPGYDIGPRRHGRDTMALLIYAGGRTVGPKGVMLDHANLDAVCHSVIDAFGLTRADHSLILPPFHVHGIVVGTLSPLLAGGAATAAGRFSAQTFFERLEQTRATYFCAASTIFTMQSALADDMRPDTSSVRFAICDAAPAPAELLQRFESRYHIPIIEGYGLPEGSCANTANPVNGQRERGTVGVSLPGQTIRLVDSCGRPVPDGEVGEILIKGPNVMRGYLNRPKETAKTIVDGWLHTGDFGRFDEDRYLVLVDRATDEMIRGDDRIHPREIEAGVYQLPQVAGAAVISPPVDGEKPVLFVALHRNAELSAEQIHAHLGTLLGKYELPVDITVLDELPTSADGQVDKPGVQRLSAQPD